MDAATAEIIRQIQNLIRLGTIADIDHGAKRVRVNTGELKTGWLPWLVSRAGETRTWNPPTVGEQVAIFSTGGDLAAGIVMPALYSDDYDSPSSSANKHKTEYPDGAVIEYDHSAHTLIATLPDGSFSHNHGRPSHIRRTGNRMHRQPHRAWRLEHTRRQSRQRHYHLR